MIKLMIRSGKIPPFIISQAKGREKSGDFKLGNLCDPFKNDIKWAKVYQSDIRDGSFFKRTKKTIVATHQTQFSLLTHF